MNIYLIGMMGSGKSTVGKILSNKMKIPFLDLDHYIEVKNKKTIPEIFKKNGEARFRELESEALMNIAKSKVLVACGGGIILKKENRDFIKENGTAVHLTTSLELLMSRVSGLTERPLLTHKNLKETLARLWHDRQGFYTETAHLTVSTDHRTPEQITEEILQHIDS
ncbi:shikimate kinase [Caldithrix abyssi]|nr:shikimate kinase [Caldithrix abyssi]